MRPIAYGPKYQKGLTRTQIAALIRKDVKAAVAAGELPKGLKVSVRKRGGAIDLTVLALPEGFRLLDPEVARGTKRPWEGKHGRFTEAAGTLLDRLRAIHGAYNFDGSEIETDYFHVNYYGTATFASELERTERKAYDLEEEVARNEKMLERIAAAAPKFIDWTEVA